MNTSDTKDDPPVVDAAFFENILETDLANIVKKASSGLPLNKREREMIDEERRRLSVEKKGEGFRLESDGEIGALERMTQKQLAEIWNVSLRTIKGWQAEGQAANDPAPLINPAKFPAWFERIHAPRECPQRYRDSAQRILAGEKAAVEEAGKPPEKPPVRTVIHEEAKGMLAMLERHRESEARLGTDYMQAVEEGNEVRASFLFSQWTKMGEQLRSLEKVAPQALEALGIYVKKDEIHRELEQLHRAILKAFRQQLRMCRPRFRLAQTAEDWNTIADEIVQEIALMLVETQFSEPLTLDAA